ncbi:protein giant-lens [Eurytemora carolleeae]|uniref:protein giant-lens n=1 Tax=Eurytemora carolleeae TaxID=1294199 RepID=UPI000C7572E3|nr:protein giant-lens [Eurytemora carolleeae]|eukprot:XP_023339817.1 protein giant-lens-like [Eurytemora affinis]
MGFSAQITTFLLVAGFTVITTRNIEDILMDEDSQHPNSVYSRFSKHTNNNIKIFYQTGNSESDLPVCSPFSVCGKLDTYSTPWMERQCRCATSSCSTSTHVRDGHTVHDRTKQYKICEPVKKLKRCKYFRDVTWTNIVYPDNSTQQVMHCRCPKNSVAYLVKRHAYQTDAGLGYQFSFACSPQTKLKCERKEPCRLFSVKKSGGRDDVDEVTMSSLCSCPHNHRCPKHHLDVGVVPGRVYTEDAVRTYSGYCM